MRRIYRYNEQAKKYLSAIIKQKMPDAQPWLHVGVKTWSQRNPFAAICIWIWDTRQVIWEHRFNNPGVLTNEQMLVQNSRMQLAKDNRQPLVGGRPDVNEWMELGPEFDASHGSAFDGKDRVTHTALYKRRLAKSMKDGKENVEEALEMLDYDAIRPGMPAETHMGQKVVVIAKAKAKNFARIAKYDESGAMAEEIDDCDPEQGLVAVKWRDNYTAVYVYDNNSIRIGNEAAQQKYEVFAYVDDEYDVTGVFIDELTGSPIMDADDRVVVDSKDRAYQEYLRLCRQHHFMPQKRVHGRKFIEKHIDAGTQWHQDKSR